MKLNFKIIFRPICIIQEWYRTLRCNTNISGHDFISKYSGPESAYKSLECELCGKISK